MGPPGSITPIHADFSFPQGPTQWLAELEIIRPNRWAAAGAGRSPLQDARPADVAQIS